MDVEELYRIQEQQNKADDLKRENMNKQRVLGKMEQLQLREMEKTRQKMQLQDNKLTLKREKVKRDMEIAKIKEERAGFIKRRKNLEKP